MEILDKGEESLHYQVGFLVLYAVEGHVFPTLENIVAIVRKDLL